ncbi:hypothetical protein [Streptomyces sp. NPDC088360]|uniref:hypothetical protein n=1 Tax=Streptomyces sp. NPDC088360 TaxID=3154515 RepID=UPI00344CD40C
MTDGDNGDGLDLRTAVLLFAGAIGTYISFLHPSVGVALLVGIGLTTLLHLLLK